MDELNINNLPAEILTEIFRYLNKGNLKNATMICKLWNNLIKSAFRWSLQLKNGWNLWHSHPNDAEQKINYILTTDCKFETIKIDGLRLDGDVVQIFKRHGFNVFELYLRRCCIDNLTGLAELLNFTPNLKHVFVEIRFSHDSSDVLLMEQHLPDLKELESLEICDTDYRIMECFRKAKLTTMNISDDRDLGNRSLMVDFLSTQDKLTTLITHSGASTFLVEMGKLNFQTPFRLTKLSILYIDYEDPSQDCDNLVRFIKSQAGNLTDIELYYVTPSVYDCVFASTTKLTTFWVTIDDLPRDPAFYARLKENCNVHTVKLWNYGHVDDQFVVKFLQKLPNIHTLVLCVFMSEGRNVLILAQTLSKLESLYIEEIYSTSFDCVKFPNLKTLYIRHLRGKINWNDITKAHPRLTDLTIERMDSESYLTSDDIDQITSNVDLHHIKLGAGFVAVNRFFEIVGSKCANLKVLDLDKSCISQNIRHYLNIDVLRLRDTITRPKVFS